MSFVVYPTIPSCCPPTRMIVRLLIRGEIEGSYEVSMLALTIGKFTCSRNGRRPSIRRSNSWLPSACEIYNYHFKYVLEWKLKACFFLLKIEVNQFGNNRKTLFWRQVYIYMYNVKSLKYNPVPKNVRPFFGWYLKQLKTIRFIS